MIFLSTVPTSKPVAENWKKKKKREKNPEIAYEHFFSLLDMYLFYVQVWL